MQGRIEHSDAVRLLQSLKPDSVQVVVADPPYGIAYHSNYYKGRNPHKPVANDWDFSIAGFLQAAASVLASGGVVYLFTRWDVLPVWASFVCAPLELKNVIVWKKDNWSAGDLKGNFGFQYEMVMFLVKGRHLLRGKRWPNVWEFPRVPHSELLHPAQKPLGLVKRAIESSSSEGELVVDPYCGSGTTGLACQELGRSFVLGDLDPEMVRVSCKRCGLTEPSLSVGVPEVEECPVFHVVPVAWHLWGLHPEDVARVLGDAPRFPVLRKPVTIP